MIVIEEDDTACKTAHSQLQPQSQDVTDDITETYQLLPPPAYSPRSYKRHTERARTRFAKSLLAAFIIWLLLVLLVLDVLDFSFEPFSGDKGRGPDTGRNEPIGSPGNHSDDRIRAVSCIEFATFGHLVSGKGQNNVVAGFGLPLASDLAFYGNDSYSYGTLFIDTVESSSSEVEVDVMIHYREVKALRRAKVCLFEDGEERGIKIFPEGTNSDEPQSNTYVLNYDVRVRLPVGGTKPLFVSRLKADLMVFAIKLGDLAEKVHFGEITLKTGFRSIVAGSLEAREALVQTSHAALEGRYSTSASLSLINNKGPINADITMSSLGEKSLHSTCLQLVTSDSPIIATLFMNNPSQEQGGNFKVDTVTMNGLVHLGVFTQPLSSSLELHATTFNAAASLTLPPQYSGKFELQSTAMQHPLQVSDPHDPADGRRRRKVEVTRHIRDSMEGNVIWIDNRGRRERGGGLVHMKTTNAPVVLNL